MNAPRGFSEHPAAGSSAPVDGPPQAQAAPGPGEVSHDSAGTGVSGRVSGGTRALRMACDLQGLGPHDSGLRKPPRVLGVTPVPSQPFTSGS